MRPRIFQNRGKRLSLLLVLLAGYCVWAISRPLPPIAAPVVPDLTLLTASGTFNWPGTGQAAVSIAGTDVLQTHGAQTPTPIASTAKLITALTVLQHKPLAAGQTGPSLTLSDQDVALYNQYVAAEGSVVPVQAGEQITEYQALEAMMLPSANNIADSLAVWAFGSLKNYQLAATQYLQQQGLGSTKVGTDASGFSPSTTSTAHDLALLGKLAMANPVLAEIVGKSSTADVPLAGTVKNVNVLLGTNDIIGVKTGNTDQAGGVFISAAKASVNNKPLTIVTAVAGAPDLWTALRSSVPLVTSAQHNFSTTSVLKAGEIVARYPLPWGGSLATTTAKDLNVTTWNGSSLQAQILLNKVPVQAKAGQTVGKVQTKTSSFTGQAAVPLMLQDAPTKPSVWWRLTHPR